MIRYNKLKCWTGRKWLSIWKLHIGIGPNKFIERIQVGNKLIYGYKKRFKNRSNMRKLILRWLGAETLIKDAFDEGWQMAGEVYYTNQGLMQIKLPVWKSRDEAWANSDAEEVLK